MNRLRKWPLAAALAIAACNQPEFVVEKNDGPLRLGGPAVYVLTTRSWTDLAVYEASVCFIEDSRGVKCGLASNVPLIDESAGIIYGTGPATDGTAALRIAATGDTMWVSDAWWLTLHRRYAAPVSWAMGISDAGWLTLHRPDSEPDANPVSFYAPGVSRATQAIAAGHSVCFIEPIDAKKRVTCLDGGSQPEYSPPTTTVDEFAIFSEFRQHRQSDRVCLTAHGVFSCRVRGAFVPLITGDADLAAGRADLSVTGDPDERLSPEAVRSRVSYCRTGDRKTLDCGIDSAAPAFHANFLGREIDRILLDGTWVCVLDTKKTLYCGDFNDGYLNVSGDLVVDRIELASPTVVEIAGALKLLTRWESAYLRNWDPNDYP